MDYGQKSNFMLIHDYKELKAKVKAFCDNDTLSTEKTFTGVSECDSI